MLDSDPLPAAPDAVTLEPGEDAALRRIAVPDEYRRRRDRPGEEGTTRLSVYLKYGCVHPRQVLDALGRDDDAEKLRSELAWRDFYAQVLAHWPETARHAFLPQMEAIEVDHDHERFDAWREGRTGFPIVDAGMRQLLAESWMHNRVRMITASFLVKDLHLPWQWGARHFMQHLQDGDLASNQHGWQWVAGTGTDPSPYTRVFNPTLQADRYDPDGSYVRRWIPELGTPEYPAPIVDHAAERQEAIRRWHSVPSSASHG
jgi:deoxyribodipyrimidine photo-lyase